MQVLDKVLHSSGVGATYVPEPAPVILLMVTAKVPLRFHDPPLARYTPEENQPMMSKLRASHCTSGTTDIP
jgi:hypothetical protein